MGKWGHSNRGSACITPLALPGQPQNRFWNGKQKWVFHLLDVEERAGVCRTQHMLVTCVLTAEMGHSMHRDAREGEPLLRSPYDPSCPLLPSRVSRVSLPPATRAEPRQLPPPLSPQGSPLEAWYPAGGWSRGVLCPHPPKCRCPEGEPGFSMSHMVCESSTGAGGCP